MKNKDIFNLLKDYNLLDVVKMGDSAMNLYCATQDTKYLDEYNELKSIFDFYYIPIVTCKSLDNKEYVQEELLSFDLARRCINSTFRNKSKIIKRVEDRVNFMLSQVLDDYKAFFITLTFDDYLYDLTISYNDLSHTRRRIRDFLFSHCDVFVANKDYGKLNGRLHFHGVVLMCEYDLVDFIVDYNNKFGYCDLQVIDNKSRAISKYVTKLTYHFVKDSTKHIDRENLIYSRISQ